MKLAFLALALFSEVSASSATTSLSTGALYAYRIEGLGGAMQAVAINNKGQVAGYGFNTRTSREEAFVTGPHGVGTVSIGEVGGFFYSIASAVNDDGIVVGHQIQAPAVDVRGFMYSSATGVRPLFSNTFTSADYPVDINKYGVIVGTSVVKRGGLSTVIGFVTHLERGHPSPLPTFEDCNIIPVKINNSGTIAGGCSNALSGLSRAVTFDIETEEIAELGLFGGISSLATGINAAGDIVGYTRPSSGGSLVFSMTRDLEGKVREGLGGNGDYAADVGADGSVVGYAYKNPSLKSQVGLVGKQQGRLFDINLAIVNLPKGVIIKSIAAVNGKYQMASVGSDANAYIVCPTINCE